MNITRRGSLFVPLFLAIVAAPLGGCGSGTGEALADGGTVSKTPDAPVAKVGGQVITERELFGEAHVSLVKAEAKYLDEVFGLKSQALDALVEKRLLDAQAKTEGVTVDALLQREVGSKVTEPADDQVQSVYDQTKATGRALPPFASVKPEIAAFLRSQQEQGLRQAYIARLKTAAKVETFLTAPLPPVLPVKSTGPAKGDAAARVTIVEFADYECPFCASAEGPLRKVLDDSKGKVRLVFQEYPLAMHQNAPRASQAALCAGAQGKYWEMHDRLYQNQQALGADALKSGAREIGLDGGAFDTCLDSGRMAAAVEESRKLGESLAIDSTPTFFVNGRILTGGQTYQRLKEVVDHELAAGRP